MVINGYKMDKIYTDIEQLDQYLKGQLNDIEREELQARLAEDEDFRGLLDDMELMAEGIRHSASRTSLEEKLAKLDATADDEDDESEQEFPKEVDIGSTGEIKEIKMVPWYQRPLVHAIAASISLLIVAFFVFDPFGRPTPQELFAEYFEPYPNLAGPVRGGSSQDQDKRTLAYAAYDRGDFSQAATLFQEILPESENALMDHFYFGNVLLELGEGEEAIEEFTIVSNEAKGLAMDAKWYLGLSYLYVGDVAKAKVVLDEVSLAGGDQSAQARRIIMKLDKE